MAVFKLDIRPNLVDTWVKINGAQYRDVLLTQQLLRNISGEFFIFQQDTLSIPDN